MTTRALCTSLRHIAAEFDRLRLSIADRLSTHEEAALLGLIFALEALTDRLSMPAEGADADTITQQINVREAASLEALRREAEEDCR